MNTFFMKCLEFQLIGNLGKLPCLVVAGNYFVVDKCIGTTVAGLSFMGYILQILLYNCFADSHSDYTTEQ